MLFSRGVNPSVEVDLHRLVSVRSEHAATLILEAYDLVKKMLRFDPHLLGQGWPQIPYRILVLGPIRVVYQVWPLDDRYVHLLSVLPNLNWIPD